MDVGLCFDEVQTVFLHLLQNRITFGYLKEIILVCDNAKGGSNLTHFLMQLAYCFYQEQIGCFCHNNSAG